MKNKHKKLSIRELYRSRTEPEALLEFARFYWSVLIVTALLICAGCIGFGVLQYLKPLPQAVDTGVAGKPIFETADLETILNGFTTRATDFEFRRTGAGLKDPSSPR